MTQIKENDLEKVAGGVPTFKPPVYDSEVLPKGGINEHECKAYSPIDPNGEKNCDNCINRGGPDCTIGVAGSLK